MNELTSPNWEFRPRLQIIDNSTIHAEGLADMLRVYGYEVEVSTWGEQPAAAAVATVRRYMPHVALIDMRLEDDTNSWDITGLKLIGTLAPAVAIIMSGYGNPEIADQALHEYGASVFLSRTTDAEITLHRIREAVHTACVCSKKGLRHWHTSSRVFPVAVERPTEWQDLESLYRTATVPTLRQMLERMVDVRQNILRQVPNRDAETTIIWKCYGLEPSESRPNSNWDSFQVMAETGLRKTLLDPFAWFAQRQVGEDVLFPRTYCIRQLRVRQIWADSNSDIWLPNLMQGGDHHRCYDLITLELDLLELVAVAPKESQALAELMVALTAPACLNTVPLPSRRILSCEETRKAFELITVLRTRMFPVSDSSSCCIPMYEYAWSMLCECLRRLLHDPKGTAEASRMVLAGILAARLDQAKGNTWPPLSQNDIQWIVPETYRSKTVSKIFYSIRTGQSAVVIALPGMGRTNLLQRFLLRRDVMHSYLGEHALTTLLVPVDCNFLLPDGPRSLYRAMLQELHGQATTQQELETEVGELQQLVSDALHSREQHIIHWCLDQGIRRIRQRNWSICFILNHFDHFYHTLDGAALTALVALQHRYYGQLCYVLGFSAEPKMGPAIEKAEEWARVFLPSLYWLELHDPEDQQWVLDGLVMQHRWTPSLDEHKKILHLSGGHPDLIETIYLEAKEFNAFAAKPGTWYEEYLLERLSIQTVCYQIWNRLSNEERSTLMLSVRNKSREAESTVSWLQEMVSDAVLTNLERHQLISKQNYLLTMPLFGAFVARLANQQSEMDLLDIDKERRIVKRASLPIKDLPPAPLNFLVYLYEAKGAVITNEKITEEFLKISGKVTQDQKLLNDIRINNIAREIRRKIEPENGHGSPFRFLINMDRSWQLVHTILYPYGEST